MRKLIFLVMILAGLSITNAEAQNYDHAIGLRGGPGTGFTYKQFTGENIALEGILTMRWKGFIATGLYEIHRDDFNVLGMDWYYGVGAHAGVWNNDDDDEHSGTLIGADAIVGIEYTFKEIPINVSLDWKPAINLIYGSDFWVDSGALSIRYVF